MGFANVIKALSLRAMEVAYRPPQTYSNVAPGPTYNIFVIRNGVVNVYGLVAYCDTALDVGGLNVTFAVTINGVAMQNAAVIITSALGDLIMWPMVTGALNVIVPALAAQQLRTDRWIINGCVGNVTGPCNVVLTVGTAALGAAERCSFRLLYHRLEPRATVTTI